MNARNINAHHRLSLPFLFFDISFLRTLCIFKSLLSLLVHDGDDSDGSSEDRGDALARLLTLVELLLSPGIELGVVALHFGHSLLCTLGDGDTGEPVVGEQLTQIGRAHV